MGGNLEHHQLWLNLEVHVSINLPENSHLSAPVKSGSHARLPAHSPLRTVRGSFDPYGSSLVKGIVRHPATPRRYRHNNSYGNCDGTSVDCLQRLSRLRTSSQYVEYSKEYPL